MTVLLLPESTQINFEENSRTAALNFFQHYLVLEPHLQRYLFRSCSVGGLHFIDHLRLDSLHRADSVNGSFQKPPTPPAKDGALILLQIVSIQRISPQIPYRTLKHRQFTWQYLLLRRIPHIDVSHADFRNFCTIQFLGGVGLDQASIKIMLSWIWVFQ